MGRWSRQRNWRLDLDNDARGTSETLRSTYEAASRASLQPRNVRVGNQLVAMFVNAKLIRLALNRFAVWPSARFERETCNSLG